jgi:hypothetical protein
VAEDHPKTQKELRDEFHMAIGYCIAQWATLEDQLFRICRDCLGPYEQTAIIYYKTPTLSSRIDLADELFKSVSYVYKPSHIKTWKKLLKDMRDLVPIRNRIAHDPVSEQEDFFRAGDPVGTPLYQIRHQIRTSEHELLRGKVSEPKPLFIDDLHFHYIETEKLRDRLRDFLVNVLPKHASAPPPPESLP